MLGKIFGIFLLVVGGCVAFVLLGGLISMALALIWFVFKLALPFLLVYVGYRLLTRDRHEIAY